MTPEIAAVRAVVQTVLERPAGFKWTVQGFGMMRTYFGGPDKMWRLNVWDSKLAVDQVSVIHDHPWDFTSWILAGEFTNTRFRPWPFSGMTARLYDWAVIRTGEGGGPEGEGGRMWLEPQPPEVYLPGHSYRQRAKEIHFSSFIDGTVTINQRIRLPDGEHARVFWPAGQSWVSAEPRPATLNEVCDTCERALRHFAEPVDVPA